VLATGFAARMTDAERRAARLARTMEKPYTLDQLVTTVAAVLASTRDPGVIQPA
jgi:hypothetical protein